MGRVREPKSGSFVEGVEDCLYLSIYVPQRKTNATLPVVFYIYGGAYQFAVIFGYEMSRFMDRDVIFVLHNHRHGILGFLSTEDEVVPGNMGLKDQSAALKWISENIQYFGGDPKRVTLMGVSSGGTSTHFHNFSPMSRGLFRNAVSASGTALNCVSLTENSRDKAFKMAELMNCPTNDTRQMIDCLRERPVRDLLDLQGHFMVW